MDTITQIALGACIGQAIGYKKFGAKAMVFGGLGGLIPDLDVMLTPFMGEYGSWKYHRHFTHALWFGPLLGSLMGWGLWKHYKSQKDHLAPWIWVMVLAILTHPILDLFTIYGTQLLAPFSNHRFEISSVSIIDPIYTLPLMIAMGLVSFKRFRPRAQAMANAALIFTTLYLAFGWGLNVRAEMVAASQLKEQNVAYNKIEAFTTIFQPFLRRIVVENENMVRVGLVSTFAPQKIFWACEQKLDPKIVSAILETKDAQVFKWFSGDRLGFRTNTNGTVTVTDLRYGIEGNSRFGWWGQVFNIDLKPDGSVVATYQGPFRAEREVSLYALKNLFNAAYGRASDFLLKSNINCGSTL